MKIKNVLILVLSLALFGCNKDESTSCNCGTIKSQGFLPYANPPYTKFIKNDCSGVSAVFYFRTYTGHSTGDTYCFGEGTNW